MAAHLPKREAYERIRDGAARATEWVIDVDLFSDAEPPYELEVRHYDPVSDSELEGCGLNGADCVDERTYAITADRLTALLV